MRERISGDERLPDLQQADRLIAQLERSVRA